MYKSLSLKWFGNNDGFAVDVRLYTIASETVAFISETRKRKWVAPDGGSHEEGSSPFLNVGLDSNFGGRHWSKMDHWRVRIRTGKHARESDAALHGPRWKNES